MPRPDRFPDYGRQISRLGILDFAPQAKSRAVARFQTRILDAFGRLSPGSALACAFARTARLLVGGFLYSLKLEINNRCTMNCRICYVRKGDREISVETISKLFHSIRSCGVRVEILGGEPLLHSGLTEIIRSAKREARSPFVTLYTNAIFAAPGLAAKMKTAGLDAAIVSLISLREDIHDACTGHPGSWAATLQGLRRISEAGIKVYTFTPILRSNLEDVPDIYEFVKNRLRASALFYQYIPQSRDDALNIGPEEWRRVKHWITEHGARHWDFVRRFFLLTGNSCSGGNFVLTIKADGSVQPCPFVDDVPMGSIYNEDIWTIYRKRFRYPLFRDFKNLPPECRACSHHSVCGGGCRASGRWFGGYARRDPKCMGSYSTPVTAARLLDCVPTFF